jgi:thiamine biosynthesis protein ThiS
VRVVINGEEQKLVEGLTLAGLVSQLDLNQRRIAVEVNREIVAREEYETRVLHEGDEVEVVHFVGGG